MSGIHARIAPSSMDRTVACPGWVQLSEGLPPEPDTESSLEGNAADWVAKQYAMGNKVAVNTPTPVPGYPVDYDMIHGAKLWAATVGPNAISGVPVVSTRIHPTDCWGEPDGWTWDPVTKELHLPDYKYGFDPHEVFEHWQLLGYLCALIETLGLNDEEVTARMTIVQPRMYHKDGPVRSWTIQASKLRSYFNIMHNAAILALPPPSEGGALVGPPPTAVGPHCLHCPARFDCKTLQAAALHAAAFAGHAERLGMSAVALGTELTILDAAAELIEARRTGLAAQGEALARAGQRVPGWKMESTQTRLNWFENVNVDEVVSIASMLGSVQVTKPPKLITPTQAIKAGLPAEVVAEYASRSNGAMKFVKDDGSEARKTFGE